MTAYKEAQLSRLRWVTFGLLVIVVLIVLMTRKQVDNSVPQVPRQVIKPFDTLKIFEDKDLKWNPIKVETHL